MSIATSRITFTAGAISVDFDTSAFERFFDRLSAAIIDISGGPLGNAFEKAGDDLMIGVADRFDVYSRGGGDWDALKPITIKRKANRLGGSGAGGATLILIDRGDLRSSLNKGDPNYYEMILPDGVVVGTSDPKAHFHQDSTTKMPARKIMPDSLNELNGMTEQILADLIPGAQALFDQCAN